jgi:hypothetical protein
MIESRTKTEADRELSRAGYNLTIPSGGGSGGVDTPPDRLNTLAGAPASCSGSSARARSHRADDVDPSLGREPLIFVLG